MATGTSVCSAVLAEEISSWAKVKVSRDKGGGRKPSLNVNDVKLDTFSREVRECSKEDPCSHPHPRFQLAGMTAVTGY